MTHDTDVLIIGGGISGLAAAWWLARSGRHVTLLEAAPRLGGKIQSDRRGGYLTERAASLLLNFRPEVSELIRAARLDARKAARPHAATRNRYLVEQGALQAVPVRLRDLATTPLWSWSTRLRLLSELFVPRGGREEETVSEFVTRRLGREVLEKAFDPFVAGTLAADPDLANARATLPRLTALERRYGSITAGVVATRLLRRPRAMVSETFSFHGGMQTLIDALADTPGLRVVTGCTVTELHPEGEGWLAAGSCGATQAWRAARVVLATPAAAAARLLAPLDAPLAATLRTIPYAPLAVVHLACDRRTIAHPLDGTGFLVPRSARLAFNGCLWTSSLFPARAPAGKALLTLYVGGSRAPQRCDWDDARLIDRVLADLAPLIGMRGDPEAAWVDRHAAALPVYHGNQVARERELDAASERSPGLHLVGNYLGGVAVRDRIVAGQALAQRLCGEPLDRHTRQWDGTAGGWKWASSA